MALPAAAPGGAEPPLRRTDQKQDLNPYMKFVAQVMDKLGCTSLDGLVVYPSSDCPSS